MLFLHPASDVGDSMLKSENHIFSSYSQELFEAVLYAPLVDGEESCSDLVDGFGQAVDVVAVACRGQQTHTLSKTRRRRRL